MVPELYRRHRQRWNLDQGETLGGDPSRLTDDEAETIDIVLDAYGDKPAHWLSELTHREAPWRDARARAGLNDGQRGNAQITTQSMYEYYDGLTSEAAEDI